MRALQNVYFTFRAECSIMVPATRFFYGGMISMLKSLFAVIAAALLLGALVTSLIVSWLN